MTGAINEQRAPLRLKDIIWLAAASVLVIAPHLTRLSTLVGAFATIVLAWRVYLAYRGMRLPPRWFLLVLAAAGVAVTYLMHGTLLGRDAGVTLLILMYGLKLLEMRELRDAVVAINLGFVLVICNFLFSQNLLTGVYMLFVVWAFIATLVGFTRRGRDVPLHERAWPAALLLMQSAPLMLVLFVLFPRVSGPLWALPSDAHAGLTGLSESMSPGSVSQLVRSEQVAFRVEFDGAAPPARALYWRGPVLTDFDGVAWKAGPARVAPAPSLVTRGPAVGYTITLEPHGKRWLFALDAPATLPADAHLTPELQPVTHDGVNARRRYRAVSYPEFTYEIDLAAEVRIDALRLPSGNNARTRALIDRWRRATRDDAQLLRRALRWFGDEAFFYTLTPPLTSGDAIDDFLFRTRRGFCEHYASAFVFMMRAAGIPARVVTGYQGGAENPYGDYLIVRQADAHAWSEVWLRGRGWTRVDPTAAVAPERVERGLDAIISAGDTSDFAAQPLIWLSPWRLGLDAVNMSWNRWVLGYTEDRQQLFLRRFGLDNADTQALIVALLIGMFASGGVIAAVMFARLRRVKRDRVRDSFDLFSAKLARLGLGRRLSEGPRDFARRASAARPVLGAAIERVCTEYEALRYQSQANRSRVRAFRQLVRDFHPS